jgi:hypothetical protein
VAAVADVPAHVDCPPCPACAAPVATPIRWDTHATTDRWHGPVDATLWCPACGAGWVADRADYARAVRAARAYERVRDGRAARRLRPRRPAVRSCWLPGVSRARSEEPDAATLQRCAADGLPLGVGLAIALCRAQGARVRRFDAGDAGRWYELRRVPREMVEIARGVGLVAESECGRRLWRWHA